MSVVNATPLLLGDDGYQISRSVRLRSSASAYFNRTPAGAGNRKTWTWSGWVKRGALGTQQMLMDVNGGIGGARGDITFLSGDTLQIEFNSSGSAWDTTLITTQVFRDPSAWYHIVIALDTTQATAANRLKLYVNGNQVTTFGTATYPTQNVDQPFNTTATHNVGRISAGGYYLDGYLTEVNFIDGQALTPSSFGQNDPTTGVWGPKKYAGTYGNNGFYLNFSDNSAATAAAIGKDSSGAASNVIVGSSTNASTTLTVVSISGISVGNIVSGPGIPSNTYVTAIGALQVTLSQAATSTNASQNYTFSGNNWTPNNISLTSGATYDSMIDTPTPYADGGNGRGNYAVLNPLQRGGSVNPSNANLGFLNTASSYQKVFSTMGMTSGKWYMEYVIVASSAIANGRTTAGLARFDTSLAGYLGGDTYSWGNLIPGTPSYTYNAGLTRNTTLGSFTTGDVLMLAYDADNGKLWFGAKGSWDGGNDPSTGSTPSYSANLAGSTGPFFFAVHGYGAPDDVEVNFGQRPFAYTPPSGFKALNTQNLPDSTIKAGNKYFDVNTYTGNGSTTQAITNPGAFQPDFVWLKSRGTARDHRLVDSVRGASVALYSNLTSAEGAGPLSSFNSNGFTVNNTDNYNLNAETYVGWQWKKGATPGFDIQAITAQASGSASFSHSLGVAPAMYIVKPRANVGGWNVYHQSLGATKVLALNGTGAATTSSTTWNNTAPTSTQFTLGSDYAAFGTQIVYLFAEVAGFSKFGSYTGNGSSDGPFVYCGFRPRFIVTKRTDSTSSWTMVDTSRSPSNVATQRVYAEASSAEDTADTPYDVLSNGFKLRSSNVTQNASGGTYIYAAFAENPFKNSLAR